jgi:hypothetical protein
VIFLERFLDWLGKKDELIPLSSLSGSRLQTFESPTVAVQEWNRFIQDELGLNPADYAGEIEERFPLLAHSAAMSGGSYALEVRPMHSAERMNYEIRIASKTRPSVFVKLSGQERHPRFQEVLPEVWIASVSSKEAIEEMDIRVMHGSVPDRSLTGTYELWNQLEEEQVEHGAFTPRLKLRSRKSCDRHLRKAHP